MLSDWIWKVKENETSRMSVVVRFVLFLRKLEEELAGPRGEHEALRLGQSV